MGSSTSVKTLKTTGRVAARTGRGAAVATRFTVIHWKGLLPFLCMGASGVFAGAATVFALIYGPWAWAWTTLVGAVLWFWIDGMIGNLELPAERRHGSAFLLFTAASAVALIVAGGIAETYLAVVLVGLAIGTWWWKGDAYQGHRRVRRAERRMENILEKMSINDGTRITKTVVKPDGTREWNLYLGDQTRPDQIKAETIAHLLKTETDRVVVRRVDKRSSRMTKVVWLGKSPAKSVVRDHPALEATARESGGAWEPGSRSILDGLVTGGVLGSDRLAAIKLYTKQQDARSIGILGMSGSGKTNTATAFLLSLIACGNAAVGVCDIPKAGNLGEPFRPALHRIARTADELEADLEGLYKLASDRSGRLARGEIKTADGKRTRNWVPTVEDPAVGYVIDELANTMIAIASADIEQAERIWDLLIGLGQFIRQSGICIVWISQTAKKDMVRPDFSSQMGTYIVHKLKKLADAGDIWQGIDVDFLESGLPEVGMNLVGDIDGDEPVKAISFDMDKPIGDEQEWNTVIEHFAQRRPAMESREAAILGWGEVLCGPAEATGTDLEVAHSAPAAPAAAAAPQEAEGEEEGDRLIDLFANGLEEDPPIPAGAGIIGDDESEDIIAERQRTILDKLVDAPQGLKRREVEQLLGGISRATAQRALGPLEKDGKIRREGAGKTTRYFLCDDALTAA